MNIDYELVGFSEIDKWAITSYCAIHNVDESLNLGDVSKIKDVPDCDLITHGSPCQSYSVAGKNAGGNKGSGTRSSLMWHTVDIVKKKKPKYVLWENVKGVLNKKHIHNFNQYIEDLKKIGYNNYYKVLNAKQFGIPQNRERIYVISIRKDIDSGNFEFPEPFDSGLRLKDMLEDNVDEKYYINNEKSEKLLKQLNYKQSEKIGIDLTINTPKFKDYANCIKARYDAGISNQKTDGTGVAKPTIVASRGRYSENGETKVQTQYKIRKLTPLECWRLMGFNDDDYWKARKALEETFYNGRDRSNSQMYKQAGNSIVVNVLEGIFKNLLKMD